MNYKPVVRFDEELPLADRAHRMTKNLDNTQDYYSRLLELEGRQVIVKKTPLKKIVMVVPEPMTALVQVSIPDTEHPGSWLPLNQVDLSLIMPGWLYPNSGFNTAPSQEGDPDDGRTRVASPGTTKASRLLLSPDSSHVAGTPLISLTPTSGVPYNHRWWDSRAKTPKRPLGWWVSYPFVPQKATQWYVSNGPMFETAYGAPRSTHLPVKPLAMAYMDADRTTLAVVEAPSVASFLPQAFVEYTGEPLFLPVLEQLQCRRYTYNTTTEQWVASPAPTPTPTDLMRLEVSDRPYADCRRFTDETHPQYGALINKPVLTTPLTISDDGTKAVAQLRFGTFWGGPYDSDAGSPERIDYDPQDAWLASGSSFAHTNNTYDFIGVSWETNPTKFLMDYYFELKQYKAVRVDYAILRSDTNGANVTLHMDRTKFGIGSNTGSISKKGGSSTLYWSPGWSQITATGPTYYNYNIQRAYFINFIEWAQAAARPGAGVHHKAVYVNRAFQPQLLLSYDGPGDVFDLAEFMELAGLPSSFFDVGRTGTTVVSSTSTATEIRAEVTGEGASVMMGDFFNNEEVWLFTRYHYTLSAEGVSNGGTNLFKAGSIDTELILKDGDAEYNLGSGSTNGSSRIEFTPLVVDLRAGVVIYAQGVYSYDGGFVFKPSAVKVARRSSGWVPVVLSIPLTSSVAMYIPSPQVPRPVGRVTYYSERIQRHIIQLVDKYVESYQADGAYVGQGWYACWMRDCIMTDSVDRFDTEDAEHNQRLLNEAPQIVSHWEPKDYNDEPVIFPQLGSVSQDGNQVVITGSRGILSWPVVHLQWSTKDATYRVVHGNNGADGNYDVPDGNLRDARFGAGNIQNVHFGEDGPLLPWPPVT